MAKARLGEIAGGVGGAEELGMTCFSLRSGLWIQPKLFIF
jgi:hypothetical protein